jgi:NitT/TauT family transport system substrate-binding protein
MALAMRYVVRNLMRNRAYILSLGAILTALLTACGGVTTSAPESSPDDDLDAPVSATVEPTGQAVAEEPAEEAPAAATSDPLKVAFLPILDSLPYYVAAENGYFDDAGVTVEVVPVASALERDQLMQSGEIDGMLAELSTVAVFNQDAITLQAVTTARKAYPDAPLFRVLAAPDAEAATPAAMAGVPIGISENTIIEYVTQRLLEAEGLSAEDIVGQSVPSIPERYQLLMEGQIPAATLPDPLAQSAMEDGAQLVIDDSIHPEYAVSLIAFSSDALDSRPDDVRAFVAGWDRAADAINADPEAYRGLLLEKVGIPPNVQETYNIPPFPRGEVPTESQWNDVVTWLIDKGLLQSGPAYDKSVTTAYLP